MTDETSARSSKERLYAVGERECWKLGDHYTRHSLAMTAEGLHKKSDIAAELGVRDAEIERLRALLKGAHEHLMAIGIFDPVSRAIRVEMEGGASEPSELPSNVTQEWLQRLYMELVDVVDVIKKGRSPVAILEGKQFTVLREVAMRLAERATVKSGEQI